MHSVIVSFIYLNCITTTEYKFVKCFLVEYFVKTILPYGVIYFDPEVEYRPVRTCYIFVLTNLIEFVENTFCTKCKTDKGYILLAKQKS